MIGFIIVCVVEAIVYGFIWYCAIPAITIFNLGFIFMVLFGVVIIAINCLVFDAIFGSDIAHIISVTAWVIFGVVLAIVIFVLLFESPLFTARKHSKIFGETNIKEAPISEYFATLDNIPLTDSGTAENLIIRKMGSLKGDMVSQYESEKSYVSTNQGTAYRIAPLKYAGFFQWKNNHKNGVPAYITVDMTNQSTEIVYLDQGMKYSPSERFGHDLKRHLRSQYPCDIFYGSYFEIDDEGNPYWVTSVTKPQIALWAADEVVSVIVTNAITGQSQKYSLNDVPEWVDNVYPTDLLLLQYNWYGKFKDGFWNAHFAKRNAVSVTEGYNYVPDNMDVNIYTGVTSLVVDESNIGFILINKRTKETTYYEYPGAEEYSAMSSAEGLMQQYAYTATFPLLVNLNNEPTYYLALKDDGGLVKYYALVNVADYQIVAAEKTLKDTINTYNRLLNGDTYVAPSEESAAPIQTDTEFTSEITGIVDDIRTGDVKGTTNFYIRIKNDNKVYRISLENSENVIMLNVGDTVTIVYNNNENSTIVSARIA